MYVERGEVDAGIVYRTDAMQSDKVEVIGTFPADSHPPIVYPAACLKESPDAAKAFMEFLKTETAKTVFKHYGFTDTSD
jgi:molybdate transport system substrate-binding protein